MGTKSKTLAASSAALMIMAGCGSAPAGDAGGVGTTSQAIVCSSPNEVYGCEDGICQCYVPPKDCDGSEVCSGPNPPCTNGTVECLGTNTIRTCTDARWIQSTCHTQCEAGQCAACTDGAVECTAAGLETCVLGQWQTTPCAYGCLNDVACAACADGAQACVSSTASETCVAGQWQTTSCTTTCEGTQCSVCNDGAEKCSSSTTQETCVGGQWQSTPCSIDCEGTQCAECKDGATTCSTTGKAVESCVGGQWQSTACTLDCENNVCAACVDGKTQCSASNTLDACVGGQWVTGTESCVPQAKVVVGDYASYALTNFTLTAWGRGAEGELGNGTTAGSLVPVTVAALAGQVVDVAAAGNNACALRFDGTVWCWGPRAYGMLGDGVNGSTNQLVPAQIPGLSGVTAIALGGSVNNPLTHACAISGGNVWCWGDNDLGQAGVSGPEFPEPTLVAGVTNAAQIALGDPYSCARSNDGSVRCWGDNQYGELGNGTLSAAGTAHATPGQVTSLVATQVFSGRVTNCALQSGGTVACWGDDDSGEFGFMTNKSNPSLVASAPLSGATLLAFSYQHGCGIFAGAVKCWGDDMDGTLGNGTVPPSTSTTGGLATPSAPVAATSLTSGVTSLSVGINHACAMSSGVVWCWGYNADGEVGNGTTKTAYVPVHH